MLLYREYDLIVNGVRLHYYRTGGDKPPFVLYHGSTDSGLCWTPVAEWLSANYDVILPDAQGHGKSDRLCGGLKTMDMAEQAAALIQQLHLEKPLIMGHSMGADAFVDMVLKYPALPSALILEDPIWRFETVPGQLTPRHLRQRQKLAQALTNFRQKSKEELLIEGRRDYPTWSDTDLLFWAESKKQFDPTLFENVQDQRHNYREFVTQAPCPTLLITSEWGITTPEMAREAQAIWQSTHPFSWVCIMQAGHNIRRDQSAQFQEAIKQFLETV